MNQGDFLQGLDLCRIELDRYVLQTAGSLALKDLPAQFFLQAEFDRALFQFRKHASAIVIFGNALFHASHSSILAVIVVVAAFGCAHVPSRNNSCHGARLQCKHTYEKPARRSMVKNAVLRIVVFWRRMEN
jgi:hypothetical protein